MELVVGNSTHQNVSRLNNLENARLIAQALSAAVSPQTASLGRTGEVTSAVDPSPLLSGVADIVQQREGIYRDQQQQQQNQQPPVQEVPQTNPTMRGALPSTTLRRSTSAARGSNRPIRLASLGGVNGTMTDAPPPGMGGYADDTGASLDRRPGRSALRFRRRSGAD